MKKAPQGDAARDSKRNIRASVAASFHTVTLRRIASGSKLVAFSMLAFSESNA